MNSMPLSFEDLSLAAILVMFNAALSLILQLKIHRSLLIGAVRMVVQLLLVGQVLRFVLEMRSPLVTLLVILLMMMAAVREVATRPKMRLQGKNMYAISGVVVSLASLLTVTLALLTAIRPQPWYDPRYAIALMGIVLGSVLNSASIVLESFFSNVRSSQKIIEARLALGATRHQALQPYLAISVRSGLLPIINQMSAAGIITLPGIMTGQVLAGMDAFAAARYQILLMFILAGASGLAAIGSAYLAAYWMTDERHRLRLDRLVRRNFPN